MANVRDFGGYSLNCYNCGRMQEEDEYCLWDVLQFECQT